MDTGKLKKFAQAARRSLMEQTAVKLEQVLADGSAARREEPKSVAELEGQIAKYGKEQVIERVAYTWFNRLSALRYMDASGLNRIRAVSPAEGQTRPEILAEAAAGYIDEEIVPKHRREDIAALLEGRTPSHDPQGEAYQLLLVAVCNHWHAAMPFMFEKIADYTELLMPEGLLAADSVLAEMREVMTEDACQDVEIIGWLYQFYISEKKDQVFAGLKKNKKITAENIPAATQLFTPHWIVRYLIENSLGRLWLLNRPDSRLEERMDYYIAPEEPETDFLKITKPEDIRICDPAAGSGHMLTYAFDLLYAIYEEEGYDATEIPALILTHNLTGVEIDDRAGALAAFALAMKAAARLGRRRFLRLEVKPDIVVLQNVAFTEAEMQDVADVVGRDLFTDELRETLLQFEQAKNFGSLIVPKLRDPAETLRVVEARDFGSDLLLKEVQERVIAVLRMAEALSPKYQVVVANPPYSDVSGLNLSLQNFVKDNFQSSKAHLYATFIDRSLGLAVPLGMTAMVTMQNWMFLESYVQLRQTLSRKHRISHLLQIGYNSFPELNSKVVQAAAFVVDALSPRKDGIYVNVNNAHQSSNKSVVFQERRSAKEFFCAKSTDFVRIPGAPIAYTASEVVVKAFEAGTLEEDFASDGSLKTGKNEKFIRYHWEVDSDDRASKGPWRDHPKGGGFRKWSGNRESVVRWTHESIRHYRQDSIARILEEKYWDLTGISWTAVSSGAPSFRILKQPDIANNAALCIFPKVPHNLFLALGYLNSPLGKHFISFRTQTLNFLVGDVLGAPKLNVEAATQESLIQIATACVQISDLDWDAYETSWDFATLPLLSRDLRAETLEDSYARLRAHWQSTTDEMQRLEEENNRIFIDAYGLANELTPEVPIEEITLTCNPAYRYGVKGSEEDRETRLRADTMAEFLHYAVGCMFGRYSLDAPGLVLANEGETLADYLARVPQPTFEPDEDNVIPVLDGDWFPDDITERFRKFLRVTFGEEKFRENLAFIEDALGKDIRKWFTRDFYDYHVRRYKKRPIYWMFSSPKGSFNALIYMHRYRPDTVGVVLNDYLREFRNKLAGHRKQLEAVSISAEASQGEKTRALKEIERLAKVIEEIDDYERKTLFPLATQQIEIDLDDGVKVNYAKFGNALATIKGLSDAEN